MKASVFDGVDALHEHEISLEGVLGDHHIAHLKQVSVVDSTGNNTVTVG